MSACGVLGVPDVSRPLPRADSPCDLPYRDKAAELAAQPDLTQPLAGDGWAQLQAQDAAAYNALWPKFNANVDWAGEHCVKKPAPEAPAK